MKNTWDIIFLPIPLRVLITTIALALALAPFFPGTRINGVEIPRLNEKMQRVMRLLGPLYFLLTMAAFIPAWRTTVADISVCDFYCNNYSDRGEWMKYIPVINKRERFWVGCKVTANEPLTIDAVSTVIGVNDWFYVGLYPQTYANTLSLSPNDSKYIAVPVEADLPMDIVLRFREGSQISFKIRGSDSWLSGKLPCLAISPEQK